MIGESSPAGVGTSGGQASWDSWFSPYFALIAENPSIKMFCYINTDWTGYPDFPQWASWGDARLQENALIADMYAQELASPRYLHGGTEEEQRARWYPASEMPLSVVADFRLDPDEIGRLRWSCSGDAAAYDLERNGIPLTRTIASGYDDRSLKAGEEIDYVLRPVDYSGTRGPASQTLRVVVPSELEKLQNGDFSVGLSGWSLLQFSGGAGRVEFLDGGAHVTPTSTTGTNWHVQFVQAVRLHTGVGYRMTFRARAKAPATLDAMLQQVADPYAVYAQTSVSLTADWQTFEVATSSAAEVLARATFMLGASSAGVAVEIDDVSLTEFVVE
jgi:hypothetical protein